MQRRLGFLLITVLLLCPVRVSAQEAYFVQAEVSNTTPFVGQQVIYIFRLYSSVSLTNRGLIVDPSFDGFWQQDFDAIQQYSTIVNNQSYEVKERRIALYPAYDGTLTIPPTTFVIPADPFQAGDVRRTQSLALNVRALPDNEDVAGFDGAVGQFEMFPTIDRQSVTLGEPVTLRLTLRGNGNIEQLPAPELPETPAWRSHSNPSVYQSEIVDGILIGEKTFEWLLVPLASGSQTLPTITLAYFDPSAQAYRSLTTQPLGVEVLPAEIVTTFAIPEEAATLPLKAIPAVLAVRTNNPGIGFWLLWVLAPAAAILAWMRLRRDQQQLRDAPHRQRSQALRQAQQTLKQAQNADSATAFRLIRQSVMGYFADKLNCSPETLEDADLEAALLRQGVDAALLTQVFDQLDLADQGLYAPYQTIDLRTLTQQTVRLLTTVDNQWNAS